MTILLVIRRGNRIHLLIGANLFNSWSTLFGRVTASACQFFPAFSRKFTTCARYVDLVALTFSLCNYGDYYAFPNSRRAGGDFLTSLFVSVSMTFSDRKRRDEMCG